MILGHHRPAVRQHFRIGLAGVDHRLDREGHALLQLQAGAGLAVMQNLRVFVIDAADAVPTVILDHRETGALGVLLDRMADIAQRRAGAHLTMPSIIASCAVCTSRLASTEGAPTKYMREVSPCQPSLITVTSQLMMSPSFSTLPGLGMPWQITWLTDVHSVFGNPR